MDGITCLMKLSKKVLIQAIKSSDHVCKTYRNIINSCCRFKTIGKKGENVFFLLSLFIYIYIYVYIKPHDDINPFSTNVQLINKPGSCFLLAKSLKNTCGRMTF